MKDTLLISKDVLRQDYLSCYGSKINKTPNIDGLAKLGTKFNYFYCGAPSTGEAMSIMFSGISQFQMSRKDFDSVDYFSDSSTIFSELAEKNVDLHMIWDPPFEVLGWSRSKFFRKDGTIVDSNYNKSKQKYKVNRHFTFSYTDLKFPNNSNINKSNSSKSLSIRGEGYLHFYSKFLKILKNRNKDKSFFVWMHLPHVFSPEIGYGSDINQFDKLIGKIRKVFQGDIFLTGDHASLTGEFGKYGYGHDVYEGTTKIPLITPRISNLEEVNFPVGQNQLKALILDKSLEKKEFVYTDTRFYTQINRKLAIRRGRFKYIYNKIDESEEFYDIKNDPLELRNLLVEKIFDIDRAKYFLMEELYYYPYWDHAENEYKALVKHLGKVWKKGSFFEELRIELKSLLKLFLSQGLFNTLMSFVKLRSSNIISGRWSSKVRERNVQ